MAPSHSIFPDADLYGQSDFACVRRNHKRYRIREDSCGSDGLFPNGIELNSWRLSAYSHPARRPRLVPITSSALYTGGCSPVSTSRPTIQSPFHTRPCGWCTSFLRHSSRGFDGWHHGLICVESISTQLPPRSCWYLFQIKTSKLYTDTLMRGIRGRIRGTGVGAYSNKNVWSSSFILKDPMLLDFRFAP